MAKRYFTLSTLLTLFITWAFIAQASASSIKDEVDTAQTFVVENMTCAACPIMVKKAMSRVNGVRQVKVDFHAKTATAIYNPALTDIATIIKASESAGFPAIEKGKQSH
mgnify:CR=1 FL=1